jgi:ATP-dependent Lon protease
MNDDIKDLANQVKSVIPDEVEDDGSKLSIKKELQEEGEAKEDDKRGDIPPVLPVLPIRDAVAFPGTVMPINVGREKSKGVISHALAGDRLVAVVPQRVAETEDPGLDDLYRVGVAGEILKLFRLPDGTETIVLHGLARVGIERLNKTDPFLEAVVHPYEDNELRTVEVDALMHNVRHLARRVIELSPNVPDEAITVVDSIDTPGALADFVSANLSIAFVHKQELLETFDVVDRLRKVNATLASQVEVLELSEQIQSKVRGQMEQSQREYYLREQMKAIRNELGDADSNRSAIDKYRERVDAAQMPEPVRKEADRELERLESIPQASPEYSLTMDFLDWLCEIPWSVETEDTLDLEHAQTVLDEDHYDLEKVKRRIIEFLAVRQLKKDTRGPILCFAGPPGVGKTSLGKSIARALGRKFVRMALGGVRDEADIRGHRRTYIGSMPGRIIQQIREAGSRNPLMMLDEVDKLGQDFRGDPSSALLEVLDPHQNHSFRDHYLGVEFDLSHTLFIATANYLEAIPHALRDRMEIIDLPGYARRDKLEIAKKYLVPRQLEENGLNEDQIRFTDKALMAVIDGYTREAGVRNLEREIGSVCRAQAAAIVHKKDREPKIAVNDIERDLGPVKFESEVAAREGVPGVVTGLAYTPVGGEILFIEASRMLGSGSLRITGQIGDVMRESAEAAFTIIRSRSKSLGVKIADIAGFDYHIHVPAGAIPKDGPSAGVAMVTALVSIMKGKAVPPTTGMTGEITLRGLVLPIGGVKEKVLAGNRAGLKKIILPLRNKKDLTDIPEDVREKIKFTFAATIDDVLLEVLGLGRKKRSSTSKKTTKTKKKTKSRKKTTKKKSGTATRKKAKTKKRPKTKTAKKRKSRMR